MKLKPIHSSPVKHQIFRGIGWGVAIAIAIFFVLYLVVGVLVYNSGGIN
jgi:hypothetical protein